MATLSTYFQKIEEESAGSWREDKVRPVSYRLRSLPNEDIFFYSKRMDNGRLVREADPKARGECWSTIGATCALAGVLMTALIPSVASITTGYQIQVLKQEHQRLLNDRRTLEVEEAKLSGVGRLGQLAKDHNMDSPKPGQVIQLDLTGEEAAALKGHSGKAGE